MPVGPGQQCAHALRRHWSVVVIYTHAYQSSSLKPVSQYIGTKLG